MNDQQIEEYIKSAISQGKSKEDIYKELLIQGISVDRIQTNFNPITPEEEKEDTQKKTILIILTVAAILVGAGIFSFIAANWQLMTKPVKIIVILMAMLSSYSLGWYFKEKLNLAKTGEALILLGAIIYGAGIFLVAQMFNIRANWPDGFILWMFGIIALAYALESYPLFYLAIFLGIITIVGHPFVIFTSLGFNSFLLTSSFLLLSATIVTFLTGWHIRSKMPPELKEFH